MEHSAPGGTLEGTRDRDIGMLKLMAGGRSQKEVAEKQGISERTVRRAVAKIKERVAAVKGDSL